MEHDKLCRDKDQLGLRILGPCVLRAADSGEDCYGGCGGGRKRPECLGPNEERRERRFKGSRLSWH